jgi:hypothetical protein
VFSASATNAVLTAALGANPALDWLRARWCRAEVSAETVHPAAYRADARDGALGSLSGSRQGERASSWPTQFMGRIGRSRARDAVDSESRADPGIPGAARFLMAAFPALAIRPPFYAEYMSAEKKRCAGKTTSGSACQQAPLRGMRVCEAHDLPDRPAKLTDDAIAAAEKFLSCGGPQSELAATLQIARSTWYRWLQEGEAAVEDGIDSQQGRLYQAVQTAQAGLQERCLAAILRAGHGDANPLTKHHERGDWRALAWLLERRFPAEYGRRTTVDVEPSMEMPPRRDPPQLEEPLDPEEWGARFRDAVRAILRGEKT